MCPAGSIARTGPFEGSRLTHQPPALATAPRLLTRWDTAVLVCTKCRKRAGCGKSLSAKKLAAGIRGELKAQGRRGRVIGVPCLGLCPKRAVAVVAVGPAAGPRAYAISEAAGSAAELLTSIGIGAADA